MTETHIGKTVGLELDQDHRDLLHVTVRFTMTRERLNAWRDRLGEDQAYVVSDR